MIVLPCGMFNKWFDKGLSYKPLLAKMPLEEWT